MHPLHQAAREGDLHKVEALLNDAPNLVLSKDAYGMTPLHWAARAGHSEVAKVLLTHKADVDAMDSIRQTPLQLASSNGHKDVAELLLASKAKVDALGRSAAESKKIDTWIVNVAGGLGAIIGIVAAGGGAIPAGAGYILGAGIGGLIVLVRRLAVFALKRSRGDRC